MSDTLTPVDDKRRTANEPAIMQLRVIDVLSVPGGSANEDRAGHASPFAWVIDGATDVIDAPLTTEGSDAAWFASALNEELTVWTASHPHDELRHLPAALAPRLAARFAKAATRAPTGPDEQPSAAAMIVRLEDDGLSYVTLGDCALILVTREGLIHIGDDAEKAGDQWVAKAIEEERGNYSEETALSLRQALWPKLRKARRAMNDPAGYGIFSITAPPQHFVRAGHIGLDAPARGLICSDGLMRLVDVMHRYSVDDLFAAAWSQGLPSLIAELRALETADASCLTYPRAKQHDDTTALLFEVG